MCTRYLNQTVGPRQKTASLKKMKLDESIMINENDLKSTSPADEKHVTLEFETEFEDLGAVDKHLELVRQAEIERKSQEKEEEKNGDEQANVLERRGFNENEFLLQIAFDLQRLQVDLVDIEPTQENQSGCDDDDVADESYAEINDSSKNSLCLEMCRFSASFEWHWARKTLVISNEQV